MLFETFPKLKLGLHFGQNMSTLNKLIGYVDLMVAVKFGKNFRRIMTNKTVSGNFDISNIFLQRPFTQHVSNIFTYSSFGHGYLEYRKSLTPFC